MEFNTARNLGFAGAILLVLSIIIGLSGFGFLYVVGYIIGVILVLRSLHYLSQVYGERRVFTYSLYGILIYVVAVATVLAMAVLILGPLGARWVEEGMRPGEVFAALSASIIVLGLILWLGLVAGSYLLYRALSLLASHSGVELFKTTGLVYLVGAATIIVAVGALLIVLGHILLAISFYTLKPPEKPLAQAPTHSTITIQATYE